MGGHQQDMPQPISMTIYGLPRAWWTASSRE